MEASAGFVALENKAPMQVSALQFPVQSLHDWEESSKSWFSDFEPDFLTSNFRQGGGL
ncbi:hypothetical protein D3C81_2032400 [compost metagenome]